MAQVKVLVPIQALPVGLGFLANKLAAAQIGLGLVKVEWTICVNRWNPAGSRQLYQVGILYRAQESRQMMAEQWQPVDEYGSVPNEFVVDGNRLWVGAVDEDEWILFPANLRLCERVADNPAVWEYDGPATIQVYGGGYIAVRFNAAEFPQGPPESGHWEIQITLKNKSEMDYE